MPHQQVDKGAIKFILSGANIMCPGLTSAGANLIDSDKDTIIVSFYFFKLLLFFSINCYKISLNIYCSSMAKLSYCFP
jgi:PUA domain protein